MGGGGGVGGGWGGGVGGGVSINSNMTIHMIKYSSRSIFFWPCTTLTNHLSL